jgi:arsenate reductase
MTQRLLNVLFVCERNSIRSIMAEALLSRFGEGRFQAFSADLEPASGIDPLTKEILEGVGLPTAHLKPRLLREFAAPNAPKMDFVICMGPKSMLSTLSGLPGKPMLASWNISDPSSEDGEPNARKLALRRTFRELETRIRLFALVRHHRQAEVEAREAQNA